jgi:uncharacterized protein (TIGR04255 family)
VVDRASKAEPTLLPSFGLPPVTEVALSANFNPIPDLHVGHLGAFWQLVRGDLPKLQQHPPLPRQEPEVLGVSRNPGIQIELVPVQVTPRLWFLSEDESLLVQLQADRLVVNWRKIREEDEYPRFEFMRNRFLAEWERFLTFLSTEGLAVPLAVHGEIAYVNTIKTSGAWSGHADASKLFTQWQDLNLPGEVVQQEDVRFQQRFLFPNREDQLTGRLYVQLEPVVLFPTGEAAFNLSLTARGAQSQGTSDLMDFMEAGRERIVLVFTAMTTTVMHKEWRMQLS